VIDAKTEKLVAFKYARRWFPRRRRGKRPSLQTLYRYSGEGYRGIILETLQVAGTRCTTREAVARFIERISKLTRCPEQFPARSRQAAAKDIDQALKMEGFDQSRLMHPSSRQN
jgi:hypothetical protein